MDAEILLLEAVPENLHRDLEKVQETSTLCQLDNVSALGQCTAQQWAAPKGSGKQGYALGVGDHEVRPHCYPGLPACIPAAAARKPLSWAGRVPASTYPAARHWTGSRVSVISFTQSCPIRAASLSLSGWAPAAHELSGTGRPTCFVLRR